MLHSLVEWLWDLRLNGLECLCYSLILLVSRTVGISVNDVTGFGNGASSQHYLQELEENLY